MNKLTETEVHALIVLLGDDDDWTASVARERLLDAGPAVLQQLSRAANANNIRLRARARALLESIRLRALRAKFEAFSYRPDSQLNLLDGAFLVAEFAYPDIDVDYYMGVLAHMEDDIKAEITGRDTPYEVLGAFNRVFFVRYGFDGNHDRFYDPDNSYINRVIDRRRGIPITLSILYMDLAHRVGFPVSGIGMPGHFLVRLDGLPNLFLDPFNRGQILRSEDCFRFLEDAGYGHDINQLRPVGVRSIIARMLVNLTQIYAQLDDHERASRLMEYFNVVLQRETAD